MKSFIFLCAIAISVQCSDILEKDDVMVYVESEALPMLHDVMTRAHLYQNAMPLPPDSALPSIGLVGEEGEFFENSTDAIFIGGGFEGNGGVPFGNMSDSEEISDIPAPDYKIQWPFRRSLRGSLQFANKL